MTDQNKPEPESMSVVSGDPEQTKRIGNLLGGAMLPGMLITLQGTLGAGKTNLVQAIAESLGIDRKNVVSPTFTLIQIHKGRLEMVHIDAYRIADEDQYLELGIDEYIESDAVVAMEWASKFESMLPSDRLDIELQVLDEFQRRVTLRWPSDDCDARTVGQEFQRALESGSH